MSDLDLLRDLGRDLRTPAFEELLGVRRRRDRRTRVAAIAAVASAAAVVVGVLATSGPSTRTDPPPIGPSETPTTSPTEGLQAPVGQQTIAPDIRPSDLHGFDVLATVTNAQPENQGAAELSATVPDTRDAVSTYCRAASDLYYFVDIGDGGGEYGRCSPDAETSLAPDIDLGDLAYEDPVGDPQTIRMWIARPSAEYLACLSSRTPDCNAAYGVPQPVVDPDMEFGFEVYAHEATEAFPLLGSSKNIGSYPVQPLSTVGGAAWLVDRAVVAAPDADRLVVELPGMGGGYVVDVYTSPTAHLERCRAEHADELPDRMSTDHLVYDAAFDEVCGTDVQLVVDGSAVKRDRDPYAHGHFQELGAALSRNADHEVVVEVVRGDPRDLEYAVLVRTRTQLP